jgi:hypothetical protein
MFDVEKPYVDAMAREDRYREICRRKKADLWESFEDDLESDDFIRNWVDDPEKMLSKILHEIAISKNKKTDKYKLYTSLVCIIEKDVEAVAEILAERIYNRDTGAVG